MEKFGIFELLDALAALTETDESPLPAAAEKKGIAPEATPLTENATPTRKTPDASFAAPTYGMPAAEIPNGDAQALDGFLVRHDAISKKVRK